jgi:hypothetical protein
MALFFKNTADLKKHYREISINEDFETIKNELRQVAQVFIEPFLGLELCQSLAENAVSDTEPTENKREVINSLQDAIGYYYIFQNLPQSTFMKGAAGARQQQNDKTQNFSIIEIKFQQSAALKNADAFFKRALKIISRNLNDFKKFAPEIKSGSALFTAAEQLEDLLNLQGFRAFALMSRWLRRAEEEQIEIILGSDFFKEVAAATEGKTAHVARLCRKFAASSALFSALPHLPFQIDGEGLKILTSTDATDKRQHVTAAERENIDRLAEQMRTDADRYKADLIEYLFLNKTDFTKWQQSPFYVRVTAKTPIKRTIHDTGIGGIFF